MNDAERHLHTMLRDATEGADVPPGLLRDAAHRATRIRRRRAATGGLVGAAAVATTTGLATQRGAGREPGRPVASVSATAATATSAAPATYGFRITVERSVCHLDLTPETKNCVKTEISSATPDGRVTETFEYYDGYATTPPTTRTATEVPVGVIVGFTDESETTGTFRAAGTNRWVADVAAGPGAAVRSIVLLDADGTRIVEVSEAPVR